VGHIWAVKRCEVKDCCKSVCTRCEILETIYWLSSLGVGKLHLLNVVDLSVLLSSTCIVILWVFLSYVYLLYVCIVVFTLDAGLLARSQYPEGPATGQLDTGFSWFPCVYKQMLRWFPSFQVTSACFSCSPPD